MVDGFERTVTIVALGATLLCSAWVFWGQPAKARRRRLKAVLACLAAADLCKIRSLWLPESNLAFMAAVEDLGVDNRVVGAVREELGYDPQVRRACEVYRRLRELDEIYVARTSGLPARPSDVHYRRCLALAQYKAALYAGSARPPQDYVEEAVSELQRKAAKGAGYYGI